MTSKPFSALTNDFYTAEDKLMKNEVCALIARGWELENLLEEKLQIIARLTNDLQKSEARLNHTHLEVAQNQTVIKMLHDVYGILHPLMQNKEN